MVTAFIYCNSNNVQHNDARLRNNNVVYRRESQFRMRVLKMTEITEIVFGSTHVREQTFSIMELVENKLKSQLNDVSLYVFVRR